jgi:hypothetical protein
MNNCSRMMTAAMLLATAVGCVLSLLLCGLLVLEFAP